MYEDEGFIENVFNTPLVNIPPRHSSYQSPIIPTQIDEIDDESAFNDGIVTDEDIPRTVHSSVPAAEPVIPLIPDFDLMDYRQLYDFCCPKRDAEFRKLRTAIDPYLVNKISTVVNQMFKEMSSARGVAKDGIAEHPKYFEHPWTSMADKKGEREKQFADFIHVKDGKLDFMRRWFKERILYKKRGGNIINDATQNADLICRMMHLEIDEATASIISVLHRCANTRSSVDGGPDSFRNLWASLLEIFNSDNWKPQNPFVPPMTDEASSCSYVVNIHPEFPPIVPWTLEQLHGAFANLKSQLTLIYGKFRASGRGTMGKDGLEGEMLFFQNYAIHFKGCYGGKGKEVMLYIYKLYSGTEPGLATKLQPVALAQDCGIASAADTSSLSNSAPGSTDKDHKRKYGAITNEAFTAALALKPVEEELIKAKIQAAKITAVVAEEKLEDLRSQRKVREETHKVDLAHKDFLLVQLQIETLSKDDNPDSETEKTIRNLKRRRLELISNK